MGIFKRVFSADYRRGLAAEAEGKHIEAARAYSLAGERTKVAEMHLLAAEQAGHSALARQDSQLSELRTAARWADGDEPDARELRRRVARGLVARTRGGSDKGVSARDRALLQEAAALFEGTGDHAGAGDCLERAGDATAAAEAYQRAGELEKLEALHAREEARRGAETRRRDLFAECQIHLASGDRDRALGILKELQPLDPGGSARKLASRLERDRIASHRISLAVHAPGDEASPIRYVGHFPVTLGRDGACDVPLREGNVSRFHADLLHDGERFLLRDRGSRNGTRLSGVRIEGELPIEGEGVATLGSRCELTYEISGPLVRLRFTRGLDRGREVLASRSPISLGSGAASLRFEEGVPLLSPGDGFESRLNGAVAGSRMQLIREDRIELSNSEGRRVRIVVTG